MVRHRGRRSIRLQGYDYAQAGAYFVTICTQDRECLFGEVVGGEMMLNTYGRVVDTFWQRIPRHSVRVELDAWVVMPNHIHGIIVITDDPGGGGDVGVGRGEASRESPDAERQDLEGKVHSPLEPIPGDASPPRGGGNPTGPPSGSLGAIVGNFKSVTTRRINRIRKTPGARVWQRNYYERVIRDERALNAIRRYFRNNPGNWCKDRENPIG